MASCLDLCLPPKKGKLFSDHLSGSEEKLCSQRNRLPKDRISSLPDDILLVILSFLTLKEMVKTNILSGRWLNLWVNTPVLVFEAPLVSYASRLINDTERLHYVEWVCHVLPQHKGNYLKEFKIVCHLDLRFRGVIDILLEFALSRKVQHLELNLSMISGVCPARNNLYVFPDQFHNFSSGKDNSDGGGSRFLQIDFKCLKSLSLNTVEVTNEAINSILLNCLFLERLEVVGAYKLTDIVISGPNLVLKYLRIKYCFGFKVLSISNINLVSLYIPSIEDLTLRNLSMLVDLSISKSRFSPIHSLSQASSCHSQLEALMLRGMKTNEDVSQLSILHQLIKDVSQLSILRQLTKLKRLVIQVEGWEDESLTMLISAINSCPCLEEFVLMLYWCHPRRTTRAICEVERGSSSLKSKRLRVFEFVGYYGRVSDVELIMHVVEYAICLEKIIIDPRCVVLLMNPQYFETAREQEARSFALKQLEALKKSESIPPHVRVLIR